MDRDAHLPRTIVENYLLHVPEGAHLNRALAGFQDSLRRVDLTTEEILADTEAHKEDTFRSLYPELAEG